MPIELSQLSVAVNDCLSRDQHSLHQAVRRLSRAVAENDGSAEKQHKALLSKIDISSAHRQRRADSIPPLNYPDALPVSQRRDEIATAIKNHQVVIVAGETGSGKTTQLPKICMELGRGTRGFIGHTQPRRIAARSVATRIAEELKTPLGDTVGFKVRFSDHTQSSSLVKLMTDGILLAELQTDRYLSQYDTLIIDEAHERSLNIDFLLGYLKHLLPKRPDLKIIITSATIDTVNFSKHFNNAPVITVSGRSFPVEIRYRDVEDEDKDADLNDRILAAIDELVVYDNRQQLKGDILVFLSGEREIRELAEALRKHHPDKTDILPLYSRQSAAEQNRVFKLTGHRRIILATNVAETSLTVPGIRYVVDPGTARISRYSYRSKVQRLPIESIAQSSANQRAGRCGRLSDGICIRLYSEADFLSRPEFTQPEIQRTNLAAVILQMRQLNLGRPDEYPFIDPPDARFINDGFRLLLELGAMDDKRKITLIGQRLARLPIDPRLGRMVLAAEEKNCVADVLVIVSALSVQDPRERPVEKQQQADEKHKQYRDEDSDFSALLNLWKVYQDRKKHLTQNKLRQFCKQEFLSYMRLREWSETYQQLSTQVKGLGITFSQSPLPQNIQNTSLPTPQSDKSHNSKAGYADKNADKDNKQQQTAYDAIHQALLTGLLGNLGSKQEADKKASKDKRKTQQRYIGARNTEFHLFPGSGLAKKSPAWVMAAELVETSRLFARQNARIEPEWVEAAAQHLVKRKYSEPHWSPKQGLVKAYETVTLYGLILHARRNIHYGSIDPVVSREIFIREALVVGNYRTKAAFFTHNQALINEARQLESKTRRPDVLVDDETLYRFFDQHIPATVFSDATFEKWRKKIERDNPSILRLSRDDVFADSGVSQSADYPSEILVNNTPFHLRYCFSPGQDDDGVTTLIPLGALNQVIATPFEWLVPGFLAEKVGAMLKSLPKTLRKQLVPIPESTTVVMHFLQTDLDVANFSERQDLVAQITHILATEKQLQVKASDWRFDLIPEHLQMRFAVLDKQQKIMGVGRSLSELQTRFSDDTKGEMKKLQTDSSWPASGVTTWAFSDLPESLRVKRGDQQYWVYPAIVDKQKTVGVELVDSQAAAQQIHAAGLRRLLSLVNSKDVKYVMRSLPLIKDMCLVYSTLATCDALKQDLLDIILTRSYLASDAVKNAYAVRTEKQFSDCLANGKPLMPEAQGVCKIVSEVLSSYQQLIHKFKRHSARFPLAAQQDIQQQLDGLVYPDFLKATPLDWLPHIARFLKALDLRVDKLIGTPAADAVKLQQIQPLWATYEKRKQQANGEKYQSELLHLKWMFEEFRVSLFAQGLKTSLPVSAKRIEKQLAACC